MINTFYKDHIISRSLKKEIEENEILIQTAVLAKYRKSKKVEIEIDKKPVKLEVIGGPNGLECSCCSTKTLWYKII